MTLRRSLVRRLASDPPRWYFANFHDVPDHSALSAHGISISPESFISLTTYNLYLTSAQASYLVDAKLAELSEVEDKFIEGELSLEEAHHLLIEVAEDFDPAEHANAGIELHEISSSVYSVSSADLGRAVNYLRAVPTIYAVTPVVKMDVHNHMSVGYMQAHTGQLQRDFSFPRPLHAHGIQGNGTVVTVIDTPLDPTSTFFYDTVPIGPEHRKLLYIHAFVQPMKISEHGTHVCGSLAGNSLNPEAAQYNGMAPMAKIAHMPLEMANVMIRSLASHMRTWGSHISTNSWGTTGYVPAFIRAFDQWSYSNPDLTISFSAGNDRLRDWSRLGGTSSVATPGSCKNLLTVGSLAQLSVLNPPVERGYVAAIIDSNPQQGHTLFKARWLPFSADPFGENVTRITTRVGRGPQCKVITNADQLEMAITNSENIRFVITTVKIEANNPTPFGVFWIPDPNFIAKNETARIITMAQEYRTGDNFHGPFSSMGPSATGVVKPDVAAPGELIYSARSSPIGPPDHDLNPLSLHLLSGTSMASPHVAGALALIEQWLRDSCDLPDPSSMVMRACAVTCSEPLNPAQRWPDNELGYGVMHLTKYLPMLGPEPGYRFIFLNSEFIGVPGHLVSTLSVTGKRRELRITVAYLDPSVSGDSRIPILADLDLVVVSPSGKIFRGNHYKGGHEEHFSTIERVIVTTAELEIGTYTVHILATAPIPIPRIRFGVVAVGPLSPSAEFLFTKASTCLPCGPGVCNNVTKLCNCSSALRVGQTCQVSPIVLKMGSEVESANEEIGPLGVLYIIFRNSNRKGSRLGMHVHSVTGPVALRMFLGSPATMGRIPAEFHELIWDNLSKTQTWERFTSSPEVRMMLRNDFSQPRKYQIWVEPAANWKILTIVLATVGGAMLVGGVVLGFVCYFHRPKSNDEEQEASPIAIPD